MGTMPVFTKEMEAELFEHIKKMEERCFGSTISNVRKLTYDICIKQNISTLSVRILERLEKNGFIYF